MYIERVLSVSSTVVCSNDSCLAVLAYKDRKCFSPHFLSTQVGKCYSCDAPWNFADGKNCLQKFEVDVAYREWSVGRESMQITLEDSKTSVLQHDLVCAILKKNDRDYKRFLFAPYYVGTDVRIRCELSLALSAVLPFNLSPHFLSFHGSFSTRPDHYKRYLDMDSGTSDRTDSCLAILENMFAHKKNV